MNLEERVKEWLNLVFLIWMFTKMCHCQEKKAYTRRSRLAGKYDFSIKHTEFEMLMTHSDVAFHMESWIYCTGKGKIKISNFSSRWKTIDQKSRFEITKRSQGEKVKPKKTT